MRRPTVTNPSIKILRIDSSARRDGSETRALIDAFISRIGATADTTVIHRDLAADLPNFVNEAWVGANFTDPNARSDAQMAELAVSDALVAELEAADVIVIGAPIYNFSIPAVLKAWIDMVARVGVTFRYGDNGPEGLLKNKQAYVMIAHGPGGTTIGSAQDFATPYLRHLLGFIGIHDVKFISATEVKEDSRRLDAALAGAQSHIQMAA
jgi:FMN-dependent NADH-azoreductase